MSNCIPCSSFKDVSKDFASSTVITPVSPTFCIASAINLPISGSAAEMAPICAISELLDTFLDFLARISTAFLEAFSIPFLINTGLAPDETNFSPSFIIAWARTVAVVVPSPATSLAFVATSFINCAPKFSCGSLISISFAIVTPSFVIRGPPYFF